MGILGVDVPYKLKPIYIYINIYTYVYLFIYVFICLCFYLRKKLKHTYDIPYTIIIYNYMENIGKNTVDNVISQCCLPTLLH